MLGVKRNKVMLVPHDNKWISEYEVTKNELNAIFGDNLIKVCHVGSTAINGIVAKPILDVVVVIKSADALNYEGMTAAGYEYCGECGVAGRYFFVRRENGDVSTHHIHCYLENNDNCDSVILFCKYLNQHPEYARQYNDLKMELASMHSDDRIAYGNAKDAFIKNIIKLAKSDITAV